MELTATTDILCGELGLLKKGARFPNALPVGMSSKQLAKYIDKGYLACKMAKAKKRKPAAADQTAADPDADKGDQAAAGTAATGDAGNQGKPDPDAGEGNQGQASGNQGK